MHRITYEVGKFAPRAHCSAMASLGASRLLGVAVPYPSPAPNQDENDGVNLQVDFREYCSARGTIPQTHSRREGLPTLDEILLSRAVDRALRPLLSENPLSLSLSALSLARDLSGAHLTAFAINTATVTLSSGDDPVLPPGALAALTISRSSSGHLSTEPLADSTSQLLVAASRDNKVLMMEMEGQELPEEEVMRMLEMALKELPGVLERNYQGCNPGEAQKSLLLKVDDPASDLKAKRREHLWSQWSKAVQEHFGIEMLIKNHGVDFVSNLEEENPAKFRQILYGDPAVNQYVQDLILASITDSSIKKKLQKVPMPTFADFMDDQRELPLYKMQGKAMALMRDRRLDHRGLKQLRPLQAELGVFPCAHGSALFARGLTQVIASATLGPYGQRLGRDLRTGQSRDQQLSLHYEFPPWAVNEPGLLRYHPNRREIGHANLAQRALKPVLPSSESFPYSLRVNALTSGSNGSSSMATVCASTLALVNAGVPLKAPVAGISIGLSGGRLLTDITGTEDHLGEMDFKVAGTRSGLTAIQLDIKNDGLELDLVQKTLEQAKEAREELLKCMEDAMDEASSRKAASQVGTWTQTDLKAAETPVVMESVGVVNELIKLSREHGTVVQRSMAQLRFIERSTGVAMQVEEDLQKDVVLVSMSAPSMMLLEQARQALNVLIHGPQPGGEYDALVTGVDRLGLVVDIGSARAEKVHLSELSHVFMKTAVGAFVVGQRIRVKCLEMDSFGRPVLSVKALIENPSQDSEENQDPNDPQRTPPGKPRRVLAS